MQHPEQMIQLAAEATQLTERPSDAAALLVDAAAMLCVEAKMHPAELVERFGNSHGMLSAASVAVEAHGDAATRKQ